MNLTQTQEWASLTGDPSLTYGVSPVGTGPGPIMGPGRVAKAAAPEPTRLVTADPFGSFVPRFPRIRERVSARLEARPPITGLATGPGMTAEEEEAVIRGLITVYASIFSWGYGLYVLGDIGIGDILPGLEYLGPFIEDVIWQYTLGPVVGGGTLLGRGALSILGY